MKKSKDLKIKKFEFILVEKDDANISEIMKFCGVSEKNLDEELMYHEGGDSFLVTSKLNVYDVVGDYLVKFDKDITVINGKLFHSLFDC